MKKSILLLFCIVLIMFACKKEEPKPDCEVNNYGELHVTNSNNYNYNLYVDTTSFGTISAKQTKIVKYKPGKCTVKFIVEEGYWYQKVQLDQCEHKTVNFKF